MHFDYQQTTLPNKIRVVSSAMPHLDSVAMGIWVGVGGRHEPASLSGMSHFIEHLLFKGTERRTARAITREIEGRGGYCNAFTQEESTCYYARIGARHVDRVMDILCDMYLHPLFAEKDINRERGVIIEEIMMYRDQPQQQVQDKLGEMLWPDHPLGRTLTGTPENIGRITRADIRKFKQNKYLPGNTIVALAGAVDHAACVAKLNRHLGGLRSGRKLACRGAGRHWPQNALHMLQKPIEQTHMAMGVRLFGRRDPRRYALKLLSIILGENMSSRLFQQVREKHGLAYSIHSSLHLFEDTGVLAIGAGLDRARSVKAMDLILRELRRIKTSPVSAGELRLAKDYAVGQLVIGLESATSHMMWMGEYLSGYGRFEHPDEVVRRIAAVTPADLFAVAGQVLQPGRVSLAVISPDLGDAAAPELRRIVAGL